MRLAQVVAVHPGRRTVDLVFTDTGQRAADVPVMAGITATDSGGWMVPDVPRPTSEQDAAGGNPTGRRMLALCGDIYGRPVVVSIVSPGVSGTQPTEQNRAIYQHPSGSYATIAPDGTIEVKHSSGSHLRIGTGATAAVPGASNPSGGSAPTVTLKTGNVELMIAPDGKVTLTASNDMEMTMPNLKITSNVQIAGNLSVAAEGGGAANITMTGNITHTGNTNQTGSTTVTGEVTAGSIPLTTHKHTGVQTGAGNTGGPTP